MKRTLLHIIYDLKRGGAETVLVSAVSELTEYNHVIVTLFEGYEFDEAFQRKHTVICLSVRHFTLIPLYYFQYRRLLKKYDVSLVSSHLFWPTFLARIATPASIPLVTMIHTYVANSVEYKKGIIRWLEKISYRMHKTYMLAASKGALDEYFSFLKLKPFKAIPLYTFVDPRIFKSQNIGGPTHRGIKMISVGRLTVQKNHQYTIEAFKTLKNELVSLDIYGMGDRYDILTSQINETGVAVNLKGRVSNINELINRYDLFIMPSLYEGFSLAVLEAMAMGMPMMLSDTPSFREQCGDTAIYFSLTNPDDFVEKFRKLKSDPAQMKNLGAAARDRVLNNFTLEHHMEIIREVYKEALGTAKS